METKALLVAAWLIQLCMAFGLCHEIVEQLHDVPDGWSKGIKPNPSTPVRFRLEIRGAGSINLERLAIDLSTPGHPNYGKHMKREEVEGLLRPNSAVSDQVLAWLSSEGISNHTIDIYGNWISFSATVFQAEQMLKTEFSHYRHDPSGKSLLRTLGYSLPHKIHPHVHLIQPTTRFGTPYAHGKGRLYARHGLPVDQPIVATPEDLTADCGTVMRPDCLRDLYGLHDTRAKPDPRNRLGVSGFLDQYARHSDFHHFMQRFSPGASDANFDVVTINGGINPEDSPASSTEASLDIQYAAALAYNASVTFYSTGDRTPSISDTGQPVLESPENETFLDQLHYLISLPDSELPSVLATSYGEIEQSVPAAYARSVCNLFAQLGARGVSVIYSSGDSGVGETCLSNDGKRRVKFQPIFPASCPFVTAVGGVEGINPEIALDFSSGGFSDLFPRPKYQDQAVSSYLDRLGDQWHGLYNRHGRAIPDVASQAKNFIIRDHETYLKISGTRFVASVD
ncbi:subtilisin-like protein [Penicillium cataractarum]|uniref:tripeptidyl-peptidase II n=1 Tax=Penicillium cataractarum TaxID=2100454 RepID=A0A9W9VCU6_9EURO|nr:subtilisin-like protein [Penicillium cataractarum]KAJ5377408.1 subtilisin-like protein [Penicillium cataractarum]